MPRHARLGVGAVVVHGKAALRSAYVSAPKLIAPEVAVAKPLPQNTGFACAPVEWRKGLARACPPPNWSMPPNWPLPSSKPPPYISVEVGLGGGGAGQSDGAVQQRAKGAAGKAADKL